MGKRGPQPRPLKLKLLSGERHHDRLNFNEPIPRAAPLEPPPNLSIEVREVWDMAVREIDAMGLSHAADSDVLHCYCEQVVLHRKASALLAKSPMLVKSKYDTWMRNPAIQVQRDAANLIRGFAQEFGLTPSARSRIETRGTDNADDSDLFTGAV